MATVLLIIIYLSFISLGLPDAMLGAGWPSIYPEFGAPVSYAGLVTVICGVGTTLSSMLSQWVIARFGPGKVTAFSTGLTAAALLGFSFSGSFPIFCLCAVPLGLGAGCVDAALNNYVAVHYESRHMSWLHCMWGVGTTVGPYVMGTVLTAGLTWRAGYRTIAMMQAALTLVLVLTLPLWGRVKAQENHTEAETVAVPMKQLLGIPKVKAAVLFFFFYCALEQTAALWAGSYFFLNRHVTAEMAASYAGLFYFGITVGRGVTGFLTMRFTDRQLVLFGFVILALGILCVMLPPGLPFAMAGFLLIGLGCAPSYPCLMHRTPALFGAARSQAVVGVEMAGAYLGSALMPPFFGLMAGMLDIALLPVWLGILLVGLCASHNALGKE